MPRPLCFMIMPYGRKATQAEAGHGPTEIDFNALWDRGYVPVIKALGYEPVRADQDTGALIISQMLERLYFADLVLADMTIPNGNVYYEVGIRHAAKETGCALFAADGSRRLFDVAQMRTITYPLAEETSPNRPHSLPGYPSNVNKLAASSMKDQMAELAAFQTKLRAVRAVAGSERMKLARALVATDGKPPMTYPVALALLMLLRDLTYQPEDWNVVIEFARSLPKECAEQAEVREHLAYAIAKIGNTAESIAALQTLIDTAGPTPERFGLLGGRYKRLINSAAASAGERLQYLAKAIDSYERGMEL
jgi:hypothetical protein